MDLRAMIEEKTGMNVGTATEETLLQVASALKLPLPRTVKFSEYKGGSYAQIPAVPYQDAEGKERKTKPFSVRVEAIDTLIADLHKAKEALA